MESEFQDAALVSAATRTFNDTGFVYPMQHSHNINPGKVVTKK